MARTSRNKRDNRFRAYRARWAASATSSSDTATTAAPTTNPGHLMADCPDLKDEGKRVENSQTFAKKESIQKDDSLVDENNNPTTTTDDACFGIVLTTNAIRCMVDGATSRAVEKEDDELKDCTSQNDEGLLSSTTPAAAGPLVVRLHGLRSQTIRSNTRADNGDDANSWANQRIKNNDRNMFVAKISDGTQWCSGAILETKKGQLEHLSECVLSISGYVLGVNSSRSLECEPLPLNTPRSDCKCDCDGDDDDNEKKDDRNKAKAVSSSTPFTKRRSYYFPCIYITGYEVLYEKRLEHHKDNEKDNLNEIQLKYILTEAIRLKTCKYQKEGRLTSLLSSNKLSMNDFIREYQGEIIYHGGDRQHDHPEKVAAMTSKINEDVLEATNFMEQHSAIMALKNRKEKASLLSSSSFRLMLGSLKYFQNYDSALNEFDQSQRKNQLASLYDTTEESCVDDFMDYKEKTSYTRREQGWIQNKETLVYALHCKDEPLSPELLLRWHASLLGDGLEQETGIFRSENMSARVGALCAALEDHWLSKVRKDPTNIVRMAAFAAAAMLGILDTLPFEAGNQRLAKILLNWSLRRTGLPFCIIAYSNREEKLRYYALIESTRRNFSLVPQGFVGESDMARVLQYTGGLTPLVSFIVSRIARAATDLCRLVEKKSLVGSEETDARLVRLARERAAEGSCIICFDDDPNIATLCCGKPVHFNCLAEWLSSNSSCPQCRADLPSLSTSRFPQQRREDPWVEYGPDRSYVRNFLSEDFLYNHSSSSSSEEEESSSSSSSSSEESSSSINSAFFYSGLDFIGDNSTVTSQDGDESNLLSYRSDTPTPRSDTPTPDQIANFNYITSDEDDQHINLSENADGSSTNTYRSESDDDGIGRFFFNSNHPNNFATNIESMRNNDLDSVSDWESTNFRGPTGDNSAQWCEDNTANSENCSDGDDENISGNSRLFQRETDHFNSFRMYFLDPELLGNVQNIQNPMDIRARASESSNSIHEDRLR